MEFYCYSFRAVYEHRSWTPGRIKLNIRKDVIFTVRYYLGASKIQSRLVELPDKGEFTKALHITMTAFSPNILSAVFSTWDI